MKTNADTIKSGELFEGKSLVNIVPRNNEVLIRIEFEESILALSSSKPDQASGDRPVKFYIAGVGPSTKDLVLNERVIFHLTEQYVSIPVNGNERDIKSLKALYSKMPRKDLNECIGKAEYVKVIEYGLFPEYMVKAHTGE